MEIGLSKRILQLVSQLNWLLDLGHYDFSSNQLHLTFQLQYQPLTLRELGDCVGSYYEGLCTAYAATVKSIAGLYQQTLNESLRSRTCLRTYD